MSSTVLVLAIVLIGAMALFVLVPLLQRSPDEKPKRSGPVGTARQNQALETLWNEKMRVLRALRDLDFDYDLGKLPDTIYQTQRLTLLRLAVAITTRLDELEGEITAQEARIEEEIASLRHAVKNR
jgi:hypothetical protein